MITLMRKTVTNHLCFDQMFCSCFPTALRIMTPEQLQAWRWEKEIDERNRPWSDEELDAMFPEGYKVSKISAHHFL